MNAGKAVLAQIMDFVSKYEFSKSVNKYNGNYKVKTFTCWEQFIVMSFAQLTYRESLRDIEACLQAISNKLYHCGVKSKVAKSTLADANESRDWQIYADFAQKLIIEAGAVYVMDHAYVDFERLYEIHQAQAFFISMEKSNFNYRRLYSRKINKERDSNVIRQSFLLGFTRKRSILRS